MSELFSHKERDVDVAVTQNQPPKGVIFLEPAGSRVPAPDSPKRPGLPDFV